jgi:hypothetical protein
MGSRRSHLSILLAGGALVGAGCDPRAMPNGPSVANITTPTPAITCEVQSFGSRDVFLTVKIEGPDLQYETLVDFGDGTQKRTTLGFASFGHIDARFDHQYERNGSFTIEVTARETKTSDRLTCSRPVVFDDCLSAQRIEDDFTVDERWSRSMITDGPGMGEAVSWQHSGGAPGNGGGYRRMMHEFRATTAPTFVSIYVYHVFDFWGGPVQGPIDHINYREDHIKFAPISATASVAGGLLIVQNGAKHVAPIPGGTFANSGSWERTSVTLRASDFTPPPDFSRSAAPMQVGYYRANSNRYPLVIEHGIDNWQVQVCR